MKAWMILALLVASPADAGKKKKKKKPAPEPVAEPAPAVEEASAPVGEELVLPCTWEKDAVFHYSYVRKRTDSRQPMLAQVTSTTPVAVTVTDPGNPMHLAYDTGVPAFEGPEAAIGAVSAILGDMDMPAMDLVMLDGTVTEIANLTDVVASMEPMLKKTLPPGTPPDVFEQTMAMFKDPSTGNQLMLKEPGKLFAMHCIVIHENEEVAIEAAFPNPFGGPPMPGHSIVRYKAHDDDTITIETEDYVDPGAIAELLPQLVAKFAPPGTEIDEAMMAEVAKQMPPIDNRLSGTMVYSRADGFPNSVSVTQTVGSADHPMHRSDTWTWTRTEAPE